MELFFWSGMSVFCNEDLVVREQVNKCQDAGLLNSYNKCMMNLLKKKSHYLTQLMTNSNIFIIYYR